MDDDGGPSPVDGLTVEDEPRGLHAALVSMLDPFVMLRAVRDDAGDPVDFVYTDANPAACDYFNLRCADLVGARMLQLFPGQWSSGLFAKYANVLESGEPLLLDAVQFVSEMRREPRYFDMRAVRAGLDEVSLTWRDVTDRVVAALQVREAEERYRLLAENATDIVVLAGSDRTVRWIAPTVTGALGWRPEELIGRVLGDFLHPDDDLATRDVRARAFAGEFDGQYAVPQVLRLRSKDGAYRWLSGTLSATRDADGELQIVLGMRDIDDLVQAREKLVASEQRYRLLAEHTTDVVSLVDADGVITWVSPAVTNLLGWSPREIVGQVAQAFVHADDLAAYAREHAEQPDQLNLHMHARVRHRDGRWLWVDVASQLVPAAGGAAGYRVTRFRDIDAEVRAQQALQAERTVLREALEAESDPHAIQEAVRDESGNVVNLRFVQANSAMCSHLGRPREEVVGRLLTDVQPETDPSRIRMYGQVIETGEPLIWDAVEFTAYRTGERKVVDVRCLKVGDGVSMTFRDVTERVRAERALAQSQQRYRLLAENASDMVALVDMDARILWFSPSVSRLGYVPEDVVGRPATDFIHPDDWHLLRTVGEATARGESISVEWRVHAVDGEYRWFRVRMHPVTDSDGVVTGRVSGWQDIGAERAAHAALEASEQQYRLLAENSSDIVFLVGEDGRFAWVSPSMAWVLGWRPEDLLGRSQCDLLHPDDVDSVAAQLDRDEAASEPIEVRMRNTQGHYRWVSATGRELPALGHARQFVVSVRDVDELMRTRRAEEEDRARRVAMLNSMLDPHVLLKSVRDESGMIVDFVYADANDAAVEYNQVPRDQLVGASLLELLPGHAGTGLLASYIHTVESGAPLILDDFVYPHEILAEPRRFDIRAVKVGDALSYTWRDVTERFESAARIADSEQRFRLLAEHSSDVVLQASGGIMRWLSPSLTRMLGWDPEQWVGHRFEEFTHPEDVSLAQERRAEITHGASRVTRLRMRAADGGYHWVEIHASPIPDPEGGQPAIVASLRTIDDVVEYERELQRKATIDELTGALKRGEALRMLTEIAAYQRTPGGESAVLFCDLDNFKEANDMYGHAAGDLVLSTVAERIRGAIRGADMLARMGGDEFLVVLDGVHDLPEAIGLADKIRLGVGEPIPVVGGVVRVTLSIGATLRQPGEDPDVLIARADQAMYQAKRTGRDQVVAVLPPSAAS